MHLYPGRPGPGGAQHLLPVLDPAAPRAPFLSERFDLDAGFALLAPRSGRRHPPRAPFPRLAALVRSVPALFAHSRKLLTLHDYYAGCPSIRMMSKGRFCGVPSICTAVTAAFVEQHDYRDSSIEGYRRDQR